MIFLVTDFGSSDIYVGQMKAALLGYAPAAQIVDLLHDAHNFAVAANAHLLAALATRCLPQNAVTVAIVDPGVGGLRRPIVLQADDRWYVGPDNGLLSVILARATSSRVWRIVWQPQGLSNSFHGRDLFAPVAALLDSGKLPENWIEAAPELEVRFSATDLLQIIYVDHYGNAMTGLRASAVTHQQALEVGGQKLCYARVFCEAEPGTAFWYENSIGLVEIALHESNAAQRLGLAVGDDVRVIDEISA